MEGFQIKTHNKRVAVYRSNTHEATQFIIKNVYETEVTNEVNSCTVKRRGRYEEISFKVSDDTLKKMIYLAQKVYPPTNRSQPNE